MLRYTRYFLRRLAGPMALICFSLTAIAWLLQSLRFIDLIVNRGLDIVTFLYLSSLLIPMLLWIILPVAVFLSVAFVYHRMAADSELLIFKSAGISKAGLAKPVLLFAGCATLAGYVLALYLLPAAYREFKDMQLFIRNNYASLLLQEGVFSSPTKNLTVYIRERENSNTFSGILVHDSRDPDSAATMMADRGQLEKGPNGPRFILVRGNRQEINRKTSEFSLLYFDRYALDLNIFAAKMPKDRWREPEERYLPELFSPADAMPEKSRLRLAAEGHHRLTWPLFSLLLALLALPPFLSGEFNRRGQAKSIALAAAISAALILWGIGANAIVAKDGRLAFLPYVTVLAGFMLARYLMEDSRMRWLARWHPRQLLKLSNTV